MPGVSHGPLLPSFAFITLAQSMESRPRRDSGLVTKSLVFGISFKVFKAQLLPYDAGPVTSLNLSFIISEKGMMKMMVITEML